MRIVSMKCIVVVNRVVGPCSLIVRVIGSVIVFGGCVMASGFRCKPQFKGDRRAASAASYSCCRCVCNRRQ